MLVPVSARGSDLIFVRLWDSVSGVLIQEHLVRVGRMPDLVSVQGGQLLLVFYDGGEMEIVTQAFDSKKIGEAVRRVVKTSFQIGNLGGAKYGVSRDLNLRGEGTPLPRPGGAKCVGQQGHQGLRIDTLVVKGTLAEVDAGVARLSGELGRWRRWIMGWDWSGWLGHSGLCE
jgi:hypothetical protein